MKLDSDPFPVNMIEFEGKKMLIRSDQTESAKEKNTVDEDAPPRMIKPKNPEVRVWKFNGKKKQGPRPKPTINMLLEKYTSQRNSSVFNRLGGNKRPRSPPRLNDHEHWEKNSYEQQPGFPMQPAYWGCPPPMHPYFPPCPPWGFSPWAPHPMGPPGYFQLGWNQPSDMHRGPIRQKRARFDEDAIRRNRSPVRQVFDRNSNGRGLTWVRKSEKELGEKKNPGKEDIAELKNKSVQEKNANARAESDGEARKAEAVGVIIDPLIKENSPLVSSGQSPVLFGSLNQHENPGTSGSQKLVAGAASHRQKGVSATQNKPHYMRSNMPRYSGGNQYRPDYSGGNRTVRRDMPSNSGGSKSVAPGTKPEPQWCPRGLNHTQKRRVQRLRALEIEKEIAEKKRDKSFNEDRPIVPQLVWKEKQKVQRVLVGDHSPASLTNLSPASPAKGGAAAGNSFDKSASSVDAVTSYLGETAYNSEDDDMYLDDDMADDKVDGVDSEGNTDSGSGNNTFTDMDINMVFALPAEFRALESEVAELVLGPSKAMF